MATMHLPVRSPASAEMRNDLTKILDALTTDVILVSGDRRIVFANQAAQERFGSDLAGQDFVRAVRHPDCLATLDGVLKGKGRAEVVIALQAPVHVTLQISMIGIESEGVPSAKAVVCLEDISHVVAAEQMRSDFVANVSHELRSPLTSLSGFIETLQGPAREDEQTRMRFLDLMRSEALRMNRLIRDLLSLSKVEANERIAPTARTDLNALLQRVIRNLDVQAEQERKSLQLKAVAHSPVVSGDEDELTQVFHNLIENALKYGAPDTEVTVTISDVDGFAGFPGPALSVAIRDHGDGIPSHHIPRLTERFYRVDTGRSRDKGGTGLGLAIVKHIVNRHRGKLQIQSDPGSGSTFTVLLRATGPAN